MKNLSLLALSVAIVLALPGCGKRKESVQTSRRTTVAQYMNTEDDIEEIDFDDIDEDDEDEDEDDEDEMETITEDELKDFNFDEDDFDVDELDIEEDDFTWIDAQADDELKKLYFSFNHYGVRADQKEALNYDIDQVKQLIAEAGSSAPTIVIEGHACQEGTPAYNLALSERRAKNVADLFVAAGIDRSSIKVVGRGQECPAVINGKVVNGSRQEREPNRRVEVRVIYT